MDNTEKIKDTAEQLADTAKAQPEQSFSLKKEVFEWLYTIAVAVVVAFLIKSFIFDVVRVDGPSMETTLINNDRLIITKLGYKPEQGDIVILDSTYRARNEYYDELAEENGEEYGLFKRMLNYSSLPKSLKKRYFVKRVIALEGQTVDILDGKVFVDGEALDEPYYTGTTEITDPTVEYPLTVDEGCVFVMGDNRPRSKDSRSSELGQVPVKALVGKSQLRIFPFNKIGLTR